MITSSSASGAIGLLATGAGSPADRPSSPGESRSSSAPASSDKPRANAYLHAGHIVVSADPCSISTVLGSCVAVYLFDPVLRAGGGNHYVLPTAGSASAGSPRYGDVAVRELINRIVALGCREADLQAKIIGGASIIQASEHIGAESLGMKNVRVAKEILAARRIPLLAEDVGGTRGRRVVFRTDHGDVWVRRL